MAPMDEVLDRLLRLHEAGVAPSAELMLALADVARAADCLVEAGWALPALREALERVAEHVPAAEGEPS